MDIIQTFTIDSSAVDGADSIFFTDLNLYFQTVPKSVNNISGIATPGVWVYLCTLAKNIPDPSSRLVGSGARVAYNSITTSTNASVATNFKPNDGPIRLSTGVTYGIVVHFEDPGFQLWTNIAGEVLIGTNNISNGLSVQGIGAYYENSTGTTFNNVPSKTLKFGLNIAKFTSQTANIALIPDGNEFLSLASGNNTNFMGGELVYQDYHNGNNSVEFSQPGTVNLISGNNVVVGTNTNFTFFASNDYITFFRGGNKNILQVNSVTNSTYMTLVNTPTFSNPLALYKKSAVGTVYQYDPLNNLLILKNSSANNSVLFNDSGILTYNIIASGNGYNNSDYVSVSGGGSTINATANIVTNANGGILSLNISNSGINFTSTGTLRYANASGGTSNGTGANIVANGIGAYLTGSVSGVVAVLSNTANYNVNQFDTQILTMIPSTGLVSAQHAFASGNDVVSSNLQTTIIPGLNTLNYQGFIMSRSNEVLNPTNLYNANNSAVINMTIENTNTGNTFDSPLLYDEKLDVFVLTNEVNNDATNEYLPQGGNAISRHITTQISLANNVFAEDLLVYVDAYKPPNTNILVYAKIYNTNDLDSLADKYWTPLVQTDPNTSIFSASGNTNSIVEFTYGIPAYPPTQNTITGFISVSNNSNIITGSGTNFTTDIAVGNLIRLYNPVFSNTSYMVAMVTTVTNATSAIIDTPVTNNSVNFSGTGTTTGLSLDNLLYDSTAFDNNQNYGICRYYNSTLASFDTFNVFQLKLVFQAVSNNVVPIVTGIRAIGVSA